MANTSARQALRQQQAREAEQAKKRRLLLIGGLVLLVIAALIAGFWGMGEAKRKADQKVVASNGVLANALVKIPASNFDTVGVGSANHAPTAIPNGKPALVDGKPRNPGTPLAELIDYLRLSDPDADQAIADL